MTVNVAFLLLASGRGSRTDEAIPKVFLPVGGVPILVRSARRLHAIDPTAEIVVAVHPDDRKTHLEPLLPELERCLARTIVDGGTTRQESMVRALAACPTDCELIAIHDAARPFPPVAATRNAIERARVQGAALLATQAPDTLKRTDDADRVVETIDRHGVWLAQTPQVIRRELLERAVAAATADDFEGTDDVALVERLGLPVEVVDGGRGNLKITTSADLEFAEVLARAEEEKC